jgi:carboxymethylenebutenolidase
MRESLVRVALVGVDIPLMDGVCDARMAAPVGEEPYPGVLYFMDAFGLRPVIDDWIARIAGQGYVVVAPNLLYRGQRSPLVDNPSDMLDAEKRPAIFAKLRPMMQELTTERAMQDASEYVDFLGGLPGVRQGSIGVTGYCMGGRMAIRTAGARPDRVGAAASFHGGGLATDAADSPHLLADVITAEVYVGHADHDEGMPPEQQARLEEAFVGAGVPYRGELYVDAPHGWTMADTAAYRQDAAERHFERLMELLNRVLKGG